MFQMKNQPTVNVRRYKYLASSRAMMVCVGCKEGPFHGYQVEVVATVEELFEEFTHLRRGLGFRALIVSRTNSRHVVVRMLPTILIEQQPKRGPDETILAACAKTE